MLTNECYVQINTTQISKLHVVILHIEDIFIQRFATPTHGFQQSIIDGKLPNHHRAHFSRFASKIFSTFLSNLLLLLLGSVV